MSRRKTAENPTWMDSIGSEIEKHEAAETAVPKPALEKRARAEAKERAEAQSEIEKMREAISEHKTKTAEQEKYPSEVCGDFSEQINETKGIVLNKEQRQATTEAVNEFSSETRFSPPSLIMGQKVATEYESRTRNFATRSKIKTLPDGKKVFLVKNYPLAIGHRLADALGNWLSGSKMAKAITNNEWKRRYQEKSRIPTIAEKDPRTVVTPYLPNVNAADYFSFNSEIDLGAMSELDEDGIDEKIAMAEKIVDELAKVHAEGRAWGEFIPDNVIITEGGKPVITESEVAYYDGVPLVEQQARDMHDFIISAASDLQQGEKYSDYAGFAKTMIERHPDQAVRQEIVRLAQEKPAWWRRALRAVHEFPRLGVNGKEYDKIIDAIAKTEI